MMRFQGGGVGHKSTREATDFFRQDRDRLDVRSASDLDIDDEAAEIEKNNEGDDSGLRMTMGM